MSAYNRTPDDGCPVWAQARTSGRDYITPEDVKDALDAGAGATAVARGVLIAVDIGLAEDASLCAFVLLSNWPDKEAF